MKAFYLKNKDEIVAKIIFGDGEFDNDEIKAYEILSSQLLPKGIKESSFKKDFGFLIDNDTNEILRPAPIFDSGYCAFRHRELWQLSRQWLEIEQNRTYGLSMNSALKLSMSERHIKMLEKLYDFSFEKSELIDDDELEKYENFVRNNARNIIRVIESRNF